MVAAVTERAGRSGPVALAAAVLLAPLGALASGVLFWVVWNVAFFGGQAVGVVTDASPRMGLLLVGAVSGALGGVLAAAFTALCVRLLAGRGGRAALVVGVGWVLGSAVASSLPPLAGAIGALCGGLMLFTLLAIAGGVFWERALARRGEATAHP